MAHARTEATPRRRPGYWGWIRRRAGRVALVIMAVCAAPLAISPPIAVETPRADAVNCLGQDEGQKIGQTQSEVWTVPMPQLIRLSLVLRAKMPTSSAACSRIQRIVAY
jgi:hypothetical protein